MNRSERINLLIRELDHRVLVLDGAMGTAIQSKNLSEKDFGGADLDGCNEHLVFTRPDVLREIHAAYLEAGADIIETDTFGGTPLVLAEYGLADKTFEINRIAAQIARETADRAHTPKKPRFVAGSIGPTTKAISVTGGITFEELIETFYQQARGLHAGGADYFLIETTQDARNSKAAVLASERLFSEGKERIPVAVSVTIESTGTMLGGQSVEAFYASFAHLDLLYMGLNCATGPEFMTDHIRSLSEIAHFRVACVPNAGLPDEDGCYLETPAMMGNALERFLSSGWVNLMGGCCGTNANHIRRFAELALKYPPRAPRDRETKTFLSGVDYLEVDEDKRPVLIGERTNAIGSRKFKKLIAENEFEAAAEVGRGQIKNGAQIIDICLANPDRNEQEDMEKFLHFAIRAYRVPLMIDSTDDAVISRALTYCQGKAIINSINLEDGEKRFEKIVPLARKFGAALVVGTIDDDPDEGMAVSRERKVSVARRSFDLLTKKYGVRPEDIIWDPLTFPCGTGDAKYVGSAVETIEGIRLIKEAFPGTKTVLGISNVSFGLPDAGREVLNSVFLYHCTKAGLDLAIVNTQMLQRYPSIPEQEKKLAEDILWNRGADPIATFAAYFRTKKPKVERQKSTLSLEERLANYIVEGTKDGLVADLDLALKNQKPLELINGPLMKGMDEVGRLFNNNELIVAEVLQSAESMKAAVAHLEKFMQKSETSSRGKVLLATVKGDVHDIGKNLVEIILTNNGFNVINLGIKVSPEVLIAAAKEHQPQIIGLSGLLVKSAHQMVATAEDLSKAGVKIPMLVGGAALTRSFVDRKISKAYAGTVSYASDAMNGLELAKILVDPDKFDRFKKELEAGRQSVEATVAPKNVSAEPEIKHRSEIVPEERPPAPPDFERHLLTNTPLEHIWANINPRMLMGRHLGLPNSVIRYIEENRLSELQEAEQGKKALELLDVVASIKEECKKRNLLRPKAIYRFIQASGEGNDICLYDRRDETVLARVPFPRQTKPPYLSIPDLLNPLESGRRDNLCLFIVTAGYGVRDLAEEWKKSGDYLRSHILSALALESAEAYAEWLHAKIRGLWDQPDAPTLTMMERFQAKYSGKRYSFGYPACPDLEGQRMIFDLLKPEEIGVELTENFMMDPEASVSAIVMHHHRAIYFAA